MMTHEIILIDENALSVFAKRFSTALIQGGVIFLEGPLGAGKTTFVRHLLHHLGFQGKVKSPTYTLVETYHFAHYEVYHLDLYRLDSPQALTFLGWEDSLKDESIVLIEWPEKGEGFLSACDCLIKFTFQDLGRKLLLQAQSAKGLRILKNVNEG